MLQTVLIQDEPQASELQATSTTLPNEPTSSCILSASDAAPEEEENDADEEGDDAPTKRVSSSQTFQSTPPHDDHQPTEQHSPEALSISAECSTYIARDEPQQHFV